MKSLLYPSELPPRDALFLSLNSPIFPFRTCLSSSFWIRFNIFSFSSHQQRAGNYSTISFPTSLCCSQNNTSCPPLCLLHHFPNWLLNALYILRKPRHVPRNFVCLLLLPHLMHLNCPQKSLHFCVLCFLPALLLCTKCHETFFRHNLISVFPTFNLHTKMRRFGRCHLHSIHIRSCLC